jgi:NADPH-dependent curcumin reductase CurA
MTREERLKAVQEMDAVIEHAERACQSYELIQMEMMAALVRAKAIQQTADSEKGGTAGGVGRIAGQSGRTKGLSPVGSISTAV